MGQCASSAVARTPARVAARLATLSRAGAADIVGASAVVPVIRGVTSEGGATRPCGPALTGACRRRPRPAESLPPRQIHARPKKSIRGDDRC
jgi:hypothetical protein